MRFLKLLFAVITVIVIGIIGFLYIDPEKSAIFAIKADRYRSELILDEIGLPNGLHYVYL